MGEVVDHHVGDSGQAEEERAPLRRALEVDGDAALVAIEEVEEGGAACGHGARLITVAGPLNLDHVGAEVGEEKAGRRTGHDVPELQNPDAVERKRARRAHGRPG